MRLQIVVSPDCLGCDEAARIADEIGTRIPGLEVELVELGRGAEPPPKVVATPTYLLDGDPIFLGNPRRSALLEALNRRAGS